MRDFLIVLAFLIVLFLVGAVFKTLVVYFALPRELRKPWRQVIGDWLDPEQKLVRDALKQIDEIRREMKR